MPVAEPDRLHAAEGVDRGGVAQRAIAGVEQEVAFVAADENDRTTMPGAMTRVAPRMTRSTIATSVCC